MTPRALDPDVVHSRLRAIRELLADLAAIGVITPERLNNERTTRYAVERILTAIVDLAVAVNAHVAAAVLGEGPVEYAESFRAAARADMISAGLVESLVPSAGMRNVLVHQYLEIDVGLVADACEHAATDYRRYMQEVAAFLEAHRT